MSDNPQPDDSNVQRISRLSTSANTPAQRNAPETARPAAEGDEVVREYEERYTPRKAKRDAPRSYSTHAVSEEERRWSAIAHGSVWLTLLGGIATLGLVVPFSIFIPLAIYLRYRKQSNYVAFHALQAFVLQLIGTVGALAIAVVGGVVWSIGMVIAAALVAIAIGILLVPLWGLVGVILAMVILAMPLVMLLFGTIAAIETNNGRDYRYPFIARWIDRQLAGGLLNVA